MSKGPKVCIIGAESWGSAISTAVCKNVDNQVHIYVYDELVRSNHLSKVMNEHHENIKYLPGIKLDKNLIAVNDLIVAAKDADVLVFATAHNFIKPYCNILAGKIKSTAYAISLVKGLNHIRDGEMGLLSDAISNQLRIPCYSMMFANSALEMAQGKLCEITIGCDNDAHAQQLTNLFQTQNCKVLTVDDVDGVELCNTLKDLVALSAGFIDGLRLGENARIACLHLCLKEMMRFIKTFYPNTKFSTFFESCSLATSIASSYADKNVTFAKTFVTSGKTLQEIESDLLNGRKLLGPIVAEEVYIFLEKANLLDKYPLFAVLHPICQNEVAVDEIVNILRTHPDLSNYSITDLHKEYRRSSSQESDILKHFTVPIPEKILIENVISEMSDNNSGKDKNPSIPYHQYFSIPNKDMGLNEFLMECQKSNMQPIVSINTPKSINNHYDKMEYTFDIKSLEDKADIYLRLREIKTIKKTSEPFVEGFASSKFPIDISKTQFRQEENINVTNPIGSLSFRNKSRYAEDLNMQSVKMSLSGSNDNGRSLNIDGLTKLIERHVKPLSKSFKDLKVRVKVKADEKKIDDKKTPGNSKDKQENMQNLQVRKANSKPNDLHKSEKIPINAGKVSKDKILYNDDSSHNSELSNDKSNEMNLFDLIRKKQGESLRSPIDSNQDRHLDDKKDNDKNTEMFEPSTEKKMIQRLKDNITKLIGGQKSDNSQEILKKTHEKVPEKSQSVIEKNVNTRKFNPIYFSKSDNSYHSLQQDLEKLGLHIGKIENYNNEENVPKSVNDKLGSDLIKPSDKTTDDMDITLAATDLDNKAAYLKSLVLQSENMDSEKDKNLLTDAKLSKPSLYEDDFLQLTELELIKAEYDMDLDDSKIAPKYSQSITLNRVDDNKEIKRLRQSEPEKHSNMETEPIISDIISDKADSADLKELINDQESTSRNNKNQNIEHLAKPAVELSKLKENNYLSDSFKEKAFEEHLKNFKSNSKFFKEINETMPDNLLQEIEDVQKENEILEDIEHYLKDHKLVPEYKSLHSVQAVSEFNLEDFKWLQMKNEEDSNKVSTVPNSGENNETQKPSRKNIRDIPKPLDDINEDALEDAVHPKNNSDLEVDWDWLIPELALNDGTGAESLLTKREMKDCDTLLKEGHEQEDKSHFTSLKSKEEKESTRNTFQSFKVTPKLLERGQQQKSSKRSSYSKKVDHEDYKEKRLSFLSSRKDESDMNQSGKNSKKLRQAAVEYEGEDPYEKKLQFQSDSKGNPDLQRSRRGIDVNIPFYPPINPRVRVPRPPFDVREHEYHTVNYRPLPSPQRSANVPKPKSPAIYSTRQERTNTICPLPRPRMRMPPSVMRSPALAAELVMFATLLARYRGGC